MIPLPKLGIIAGGGRLPIQLVEACKASHRPYFVLALEGITDAETFQDSPHAIVRLAAVGAALEKLHEANVSDVVIAGRVQRPSLPSLMPDKGGARLLSHIGTAFFSGDNALLKSIVSFMEKEGFHVVGADDVLKSLLPFEGILGSIQPDASHYEDIKLGVRVAHELGKLDIGQAVVVENGYVLGVEAAEGTDVLIARCAALKQIARGGVLVKVKKPAQEARIDLPTIGVVTVEKIHAAGFMGIAIEAGGSLITDRDRVISLADELGIFIVGVRHE
jgi:DUF1009 family protein